MRSRILFASTLLLLASLVFAADPLLVAYKDSTGKLTQQSTVNLKEMRRIAKNKGTVTVWVDFDITFVGDPALRTPETIAQQAIDRQNAIDAVVGPLSNSGDAVELEPSEYVRNLPGCLVEATDKGLRTLANNPLVKHIGYKPKAE